MMERSTGSSDSEEETVSKPKEEGAPKLPEGKSEGEFLLEQAAKSGGSPKRKAEKAAEFKLGPQGTKFDSLTNSVDNFAETWNKIKGSFSGLVIKDANEQDVDLAGNLHKHVDNIIGQAQRHLETAAQKEMRGYQARTESISSQLASRSPINVARRVFPNRSGRSSEFDDLTRFAPLSLQPGEETPPSEQESLNFLEKYANNDFVQKAKDFDALSPADHANHARNLLASLTVAIPKIANEIHSTPDLKAQMVKSGKIGVTGDQARKLLNPSLLDVHNKTEDYAPEDISPVSERAKTVHDAFGLNHHLTRLTALANSEETQRSTEQRFGMIKNAYLKKYGNLLSKRKNLRSDLTQLVSTNAQPGYKFDKDGTEVATSTSIPTVAAAVKAGNGGWGRDHFHRTFAGASADTIDNMYNANLEASGKNRVSVWNGLTAKEWELKGQAEHLGARATSLSELSGDHPLASKWNALINQASGMNTSEEAIRRGHNLLDRIRTSMQKNNVAPLESKTTVRPRSETDPIPTLSEFIGLARPSRPIVQSESFLRTGEHEAEVDPTMGGLKGADEPMTMGHAFGYTGFPAGSRVTSETITSPSASGFNIPSDKAVSDFVAGKRERRRQALTDAADRAKRFTDEKFVSSMDPWLTGGVKPISIEDVTPTDTKTPEVLGRAEVTGRKKRAAVTTPVTKEEPATSAPDGINSAERAAALFDPGSRPRGR
jgi:hypothetical protein